MTDFGLSRFGKVIRNFNLSSIARFGVGGIAEFFVQPFSEEDLCSIIKNYRDSITVIGNCSNLLIRDGGISGITVRLGNAFSKIFTDGDLIYAGAGANANKVAYAALNNSLGGLEFFVGIPGTIGGALQMNAGCFGSDTSSILEYVLAVNELGKICRLLPKDIEYVYRGHKLCGKWIFLEAVFRGIVSDYQKIHSRMKRVMGQKITTQPFQVMTCGSTFKNPPGHSAWKLIDSSGCRGMRVGAVVVSDLHCNFLINEGAASAAEIEFLGNIIRKKVYDIHGIPLEWEIKIIGQHF